MSRVLPFKRPTLDHELWEQVDQTDKIAMTKEIAKYYALRDRGDSSKSDYWTKDGRKYSENDDTMVYDFIALSNRFDGWFEKLRLDRAGLLQEIEDYVLTIDGAQTYFEGKEEQWLELDFGVLGRVVGAAVANIGYAEGWWRATGTDAKMALRFWNDLDREVPKVSEGGINAQKWDSISRHFRERNFDPNSEILRAEVHRPSSPFWQRGTSQGKVYYPNPIVNEHRKRIREEYSRADPEKVKELAYYHGKLTMKLIQKAMVHLSRGNYAEFAVRIHAICAHHVMRTSVIQQKIGLHLVSNLAVRKMTRSVGAQNVPDIAEMATGFRFGKVLEILFKSKLIDWYTIEKEKVDEVLKNIS